jgi:hypothetical protein
MVDKLDEEVRAAPGVHGTGPGPEEDEPDVVGELKACLLDDRRHLIGTLVLLHSKDLVRTISN